MQEDTFQKYWIKRATRIRSSFFNYDSFLDLGFESVFIALTAGIIFGFLVGAYPALGSVFPVLPSTNLLLFFAFAVPLTGSTHYNPRLGLISAGMLLFTTRATQILLGIAPFNPEFILLAGFWSVAQIFLIGYIPGRIIVTSENISILFKGLLKVALLYGLVEYAVWTWTVSTGSIISPAILLVFPLISIPLIAIFSMLSTFLFTNTFCPYMMIPLISSFVSGERHCGAGNFVFKLGERVSINDEKIKKASKKGFKLISKLPSVTVFSCPRGGVISVYNSGSILVRKVNKGTADRINHHLTPILID
jgi:hypothetical protein